MDIQAEQALQGIARYLVHDQLLSYEQAILAQRNAAVDSVRFLRYLVINKIVTSKDLAKCVAKYFGCQFIDLNNHTYEYSDQSWRWEHAIIPAYQRNGMWYVAIEDPTDKTALDAFQFHTGCPVRPLIAESDKLHALLHLMRSQQEQQQLAIYINNKGLLTDAYQITDNDQNSPVMQFIHRILHDAVRKGASDVHFEPYQTHYRVRLRLDGILHDVARPPEKIADSIAVCIKVMSQLDITERRRPQDGRFVFKSYLPNTIDARVSLCPTISGEKIVIRLLNTSLVPPDLHNLGLNPKQKLLFLDAISRPQGMILVTGPTGSGKTITLYALLHHLNTDQINISTVEDPVEIQLPGINQVQINVHGLGFTETLKSFLRQDPDVMMIGEMRDQETAEIALKAALTGHLVLSTLHTNSAADTLARLMNIGLEAVYLASAIRMIVAQRLVRRLCDVCKKPCTHNHQKYQAVGCSECLSGYSGRLAIFEVMPISSTLSELVLNHASARILHEQAVLDGMQTLYQNGLEKVHAGLTTMEEISRVSAL